MTLATHVEIINSNVILSERQDDQINQVNRDRLIEFVRREHDHLENLIH
jgi:hypothetical protein